MFCNQCGKELRDGALFCTNCGAKQAPENTVDEFDKTTIIDSNFATPADESIEVEQVQPTYPNDAYDNVTSQPSVNGQQNSYPAQVNTGYQQQPVVNNNYYQPSVANVDYQQPPVLNNNYGQQPVANNNYYQNNVNYNNATMPVNTPSKKVSFGEAIKLFFTNYVNFSGRSSKSEYWWAFLFQGIVILCLCWIPILSGLAALGFAIPNLSLSIRRLRDTGKSWSYIFMGLIPVAGVIILIIQFCKDSVGNNQ